MYFFSTPNIVLYSSSLYSLFITQNGLYRLTPKEFDIAKYKLELAYKDHFLILCYLYLAIIFYHIFSLRTSLIYKGAFWILLDLKIKWIKNI